jgi:hypothetical protein
VTRFFGAAAWYIIVRIFFGRGGFSLAVLSEAITLKEETNGNTTRTYNFSAGALDFS